MTMRCVLLVLVVFSALQACTTAVLMADRDAAYESDGDRYVRLRLDTVKLDVVEVPPGEVQKENALCLQTAPPGAAAPCRALQFRLPFMAWNGHDEAWPVKLGMFELVRLRAGDTPRSDRLTAPAPDLDQTVALVAPRSGARFEVLVHVAGLGPDDDPLRGEYRLTVRSQVDMGETLLVEKLSVGSFDQLSQIGRFLGTATLLLVALAAI
jgi:hypothetical protein